MALATDAPLRALDGDAIAALLAGVATAGTLAHRRPAIAALAAGAPGLAGLATRLAAPLDAPALLDLAAAAARLRGVVACPAAARGALAVPEATQAGHTRLEAGDARFLYQAIRGRAPLGKPQRFALLRRAVQQGWAADLRMLEGWRAALRDPDVVQVAAMEAAPLFGRALEAELEALMDRRSNKTDHVCLLRGLAAIRGPAIVPLARQIAEQGSKLMRAGALLVLADHAPAEAEPLLGAAFRADNEASVRRAAARALGAIGSDASTELLLATLAGEDVSRRRDAGYGLMACRHPVVPRRLLAMFQGARDAGDEQQAKLVLETLGDRRDTAAAATLLDWWRAPDCLELRESTGVALVRIGEPESLEAVAESLEDSQRNIRHVALEAALALPPARTHERLAPLLTPARMVSDTGFARGVEILSWLKHMLERSYDHSLQLDPRWAETLLTLVEAGCWRNESPSDWPERLMLQLTLAALTRIGDGPALVRLLYHLDTPLWAGAREDVYKLLGKNRDPVAAAVLREWADARVDRHDPSEAQKLRQLTGG